VTTPLSGTVCRP